MASTNFSNFSKFSSGDNTTYLVGYSATRDNKGRYERKLPLTGIKFDDNKILLRANKEDSESGSVWYSISIVDMGGGQCYLNLEKVGN